MSSASSTYNTKGKSAATTSDSASTGSFVAGAAAIGNTSWDNIFADDDDENQENEDERYVFNKDSIIFLIDAQAAMFEQMEAGEIPFHNSVKCAIATLTDKIISSDSDLVGVCLYGTKQKRNLNDFESIYVLQDLDVPDAHRIIELESVLKKKDSPYGYAEKEFPFGDALWTCSSMFSNCTVKVGSKRIFLFTNDDAPNSTNKHFREQSFQRAKDLAELGIEIELFSMNKSGHMFDPTIFYQFIFSLDEDEDTGVLRFDASSKFEELRASVRRKEFKKRAINRTSLVIGNNMEIGVKMYNLVQEAKKNSFTWLDSKTNQPLKSLTKWVCADTGALLMDSQIKYYYVFGGERVVFDKEEVAKIKTIDSPGLRLMGFKPRSALKPYLHIKTSCFIYPDEQSVKGSTVAFAALLDRMLAMDKIGIARLTVRASVRFVALVPQPETFDADGCQTSPSGLHVLALPYADDIRNIQIDPTPKAKPDQILKAKKMVKTLRIKFDSQNFENPSLQKHYANLQALALERDTVDETPDYVVPDLDGMDKYQQLIEDFKNSVFPANYDELKGMKGRRRRKEDDGEEGEQTVKRKKIDLGDPDELNKQVIDYLATGQLSRLTIAELKQYLQLHKVKVTSKDRKDDLIRKVQEHREQEADD